MIRAYYRQHFKDKPPTNETVVFETVQDHINNFLGRSTGEVAVFRFDKDEDYHDFSDIMAVCRAKAEQSVGLTGQAQAIWQVTFSVPDGSGWRMGLQVMPLIPSREQLPPPPGSGLINSRR